MATKETCYRVLGIAGLIASGKSTLSRRLAEVIECSWVSFGDYIRRIAEERGLEQSRHNLQILGTQLINQEGVSDFVRNFLKSSGCNNHELLIVDGVRHLDIWNEIRTISQNAFLVFIDIADQERLRRAAKRDKQNIQSTSMTMGHEMERNARSLLGEADLVLAENSLEDWVAKIIVEIEKSGFLGA